MITIVPTIDVEGVHGRRPFEQMVLGDLGEAESWGVYRLAGIFNEAGVSGTFFVDVYEYLFWGEDALARVCENLCRMGQDVQLHTHPAWRDDPADFPELRALKRERGLFPQETDLIAKLTLEQQVELLEHGSELIRRWTGRRPVVHRGGGYSINHDTVTALRRLGIPADSSMNRSHANSVLTWSHNRIVEREGVLELPVTVMEYCLDVAWNGRRNTLFSKLMKTDLDTCTLSELQEYVVQAEELGLKFMNLFMHSYSLLDFDYFYRRFTPDPLDEAKLRAFLSWVAGRPGASVKDCATFQGELRRNPETMGDTDGVPQITANRHILTLGAQKVRNLVLERVVR